METKTHEYKTISTQQEAEAFKDKLLTNDFPMFYSNIGSADIKTSTEILSSFCSTYDLDLTKGGHQFTTHTEALFSATGTVFLEVQMSFSGRENLRFILKGNLIKDKDDGSHFLNINFIYS